MRSEHEIEQDRRHFAYFRLQREEAAGAVFGVGAVDSGRPFAAVFVFGAIIVIPGVVVEGGARHARRCGSFHPG